jgi:hypothetical protein
MADDARPWTAEELETLLRMRAAGLGSRLIAPHVGRSRFAVRNKIARLATPANPAAERPGKPGWRENDDALHLRLLAEAMMRGEHLPHRRAA